MDKERRRELLQRGMPDVKWEGEPMMSGWYTEEEVDAVVESVRSSMDWTVGFGFWCEEIVEFERRFAAYCGTEYAVSITSCGAGLDMAMMALDLQPGDEVICPAINYWAGHYAVIGYGGKLILCDVVPQTLCADPADVEKRITPRTRAILVTHMNGLSADMDALLEVAERHPHPTRGPIPVIGDVARACGGDYKDTKIGKKGWMNIFSFHSMKLMTTLGEGGMITTDDPDLYQRLRAIRMWGDSTDDWGGNYKMTKIQASVGMVQLRRLDEMIDARRLRARQRTALLADLPQLTLPCEPPGYKHTYYLYTCMVPKEWAGEKRDRYMKMLRADYGVGSEVLNRPTYQQRPLVRKHTEGQHLPLSEELGARLFCPSLHPLMSEDDNAYIAAAMQECVERVGKGE